MGTIFVDNLEPQSGTSLTLGASGDTIGLASGASQTLAVNTPAFEAYPSADLSVASSTSVKVQGNTERFDTDSAYDNSSNYRFTPQVAGRYFTYCSGTYNLVNGGIGLVVEIRKNGSAVLSGKIEDSQYSGAGNYKTITCQGVVQLNGSSDYLEMFTSTTSGATRTLSADSQRTIFGAYKIIGA
jgi:hypothetical protein